jgi:hypothetical protein
MIDAGFAAPLSSNRYTAEIKFGIYMLNKNPVHLLFILFATVMPALACGPSSIISNPSSTRSLGTCPSLPTEFNESYLYGIWIAKYGASTDTLVINPDGTYDQSFVRETDGYSFKNDGNTWWLENRASGEHYLHLNGMRRCDNTDELCANSNGGGGDFSYLDFCENRFVKMPDEVIILVTGIPNGADYSPRGIWLWHMSPSVESGSYHFEYIER